VFLILGVMLLSCTKTEIKSTNQLPKTGEIIKCETLTKRFLKPLEASPETFDTTLLTVFTPQDVARLVYCADLLLEGFK